MRLARLEAEFVEFIPEQLAPGVLYVSRRYSTAAHLCCCGCGLEVVTPLNPAKWQLSERGRGVSLSPSIGNWGFPCQSHYWIDGGQVRWAGAMSPAAISAARILRPVGLMRSPMMTNGRSKPMTTSLVAELMTVSVI